MKLADRIYEDLRARIEDEEGVPCRLTFSALSAHYGVSLTPVRKAVKQLLTEGYLLSSENGRLQFNSTPPKGESLRPIKAVEPPTDHEQLIRRDLIRRSLIGNSRYLREGAAAAKYGIGRTVLRPIFSRLAGQGLLDHVPRCGWRVRPFDQNDLGNFIVVRESLELAALEQAREKLDKGKLESFLAENQVGANPRTGGLNNGLHSYWIQLSGNRYIIDFFNHQALYYTTLFDFAAPEAHVVAEMAAQHCDILAPLIRDEFSVAKKALVRHIRSQKPIVETLLEQIQLRHTQRGT